MAERTFIQCAGNVWAPRGATLTWKRSRKNTFSPRGGKNMIILKAMILRDVNIKAKEEETRFKVVFECEDSVEGASRSMDYLIPFINKAVTLEVTPVQGSLEFPAEK
jgi:hypothetical protein